MWISVTQHKNDAPSFNVSTMARILIESNGTHITHSDVYCDVDYA